MAKKRKLNISRLILIIVTAFLLISLAVLLVIKIVDANKKEPFDVNSLKINELDYSNAKQFDFDLHSKKYMLIRLNDFKVLYAKDTNTKIYPASLTKVLTMDAVLNNCDDTSKTSSYTDEQWDLLVKEDASMAGLRTNKEYKISDILYALVLPSGGDAATCLDNYLKAKGTNLIDSMNNLCKDLNLKNSHFTNPTGLHDDNLYTTLDDYTKIVINTLLNSDGKKVLKTLEYDYNEYTKWQSTLKDLAKREDDIKVFGGKTGFTLEAGMNIMVLFEANNRSYMIVLADANGSPYTDGQYHVEDVNKILDELFK